jgi:hypothetical protein
LPNTATLTAIERSSKLLHQQKIVQKKRKNDKILIGFSMGVMSGPKFWQ